MNNTRNVLVRQAKLGVSYRVSRTRKHRQVFIRVEVALLSVPSVARM
ncbi:MAG: hypothetical protein GY928_06730 [Colwellia sp.]|nr:hypothetical protein [Colwellia sp.]